jgi:hypothetical protein
MMLSLEKALRLFDNVEIENDYGNVAALARPVSGRGTGYRVRVARRPRYGRPQVGSHLRPLHWSAGEAVPDHMARCRQQCQTTSAHEAEAATPEGGVNHGQ